MRYFRLKYDLNHLPQQNPREERGTKLGEDEAEDGEDLEDPLEDEED